jgi:plasmid stabilization system protein ParE
MKVSLRPEAQEDLESAAHWYEERRRGLGGGLLDEVLHTIGLIAENPRRYPRIHGEIRRAVTPRFPFGVFYLMEGDAVVVIAVMHASRDPARWKERA